MKNKKAVAGQSIHLLHPVTAFSFFIFKTLSSHLLFSGEGMQANLESDYLSTPGFGK